MCTDIKMEPTGLQVRSLVPAQEGTCRHEMEWRGVRGLLRARQQTRATYWYRHQQHSQPEDTNTSGNYPPCFDFDLQEHELRTNATNHKHAQKREAGTCVS